MPNSVAGIIKKDGKFLLGKRKSGGSIGGKWEFPGGKVKKNEALTDALIREMKEELDCDIIVKDFITKKEFSSNDHKFSLHAYYIDLNEKNIKYIEHDEFKWFHLSEITNLGDDLADSDKLLIPSLS